MQIPNEDIQIPQVNKAYILIAYNLELATAQQLLEGTGQTLEGLKDIDTVDAPVAIKAVNNINKYCDNPVWATILGAHLGIASHGPVGYASLSAPTVGKSLTAFVDWFRIRCDTYSGKLSQTEVGFEIIISDTTSDSVFSVYFFEAFMRAFEILIALLLGRSPEQETSLHFRIPEGRRSDYMRKAYDSKLFFGCSENKLVIPQEIWFQASPLYDKDSYEFNLAKCRQLDQEASMRGRIDAKVRHIIRKHLEQTIMSNEPPARPPSMLEICSTLHIAERTLIRKLKERDTSYKNILEEERHKYAKILLKNVRYTVYQIADLLGYRESANFCRAFKRWTGLSPTDFRRKPEN